MYGTTEPGWKIHDQTRLCPIDITFDNERSRWQTPSLNSLVSQLVTHSCLLKGSQLHFAGPSQNLRDTLGSESPGPRRCRHADRANQLQLVTLFRGVIG